MDSRGFREGLLLLTRGRGQSDRPHVSGRAPLMLWCIGALVVTFVLVGLTGFGTDVLVVVLLCCCVVALERTVGDWLSDLIGAGVTSAVFAVLLGAGAWVLFAEGGKADQFYAAAESHGYRTLYHTTTAEPQADAPPAAGDAASANTSAAPTAGGTRRTPDPARVAAAPAESDTREAAARPIWSLGRAPQRLQQEPVTVVRIDVPELAVAGRKLTVHARVSSGDKPLGGASVAFTVDGRSLGTSVTSASGTASTAFLPRLPRTYQVEARVTGTGLRRQPTARALLYVLPSAASWLLHGAAKVSV